MAGPSADKTEAGVIYAPSFQENVYQGAHGNESVAEAFVTLNKAPAATEIRLMRLPVGMRINSVQIVTDGIGDSETVTIKSGDHELVHADDVHTKTAQFFVVQPYTTQADGELLTATTGGSAATGGLSVLVRYSVVGY
ncbi:hypothetical protein DJ252_20120 [Salmonella enterica subsp. enterica serovar Uzaramo]|uniref:Uncharacterized protein n=1 Tax=Salmonella enterica TaxID=28901 RepID=A0A759WAN5_SALER|nr:hypothetical protein [Salmonella enterica]EEE9947256.1 hypothetical protein [Salmonella enterica subsp. enterica serovar Uzaramo]EIM5532488.1 hypothetical protein [Salmonella enterica subsp. enterica]ELD8107717.1 hypothetical protein [Salmonella enterica subsp. enterica serovar Benin]EBB6485211.1 hypothetical protein [Salmonella enterica]